MIAINTGLILIMGGLLIPLFGKQLGRFASVAVAIAGLAWYLICLLYTSPSPRDRQKSRMPSSA